MQRIFDEVITRAQRATDAVRLFHGRGQCYDGLEFVTVDWFSPLLLVTFCKAPDADWLVNFTRGISGLAVEHIEVIAFQYRNLPGAPTEVIKGKLPSELNAHEAGLDYRLTIDKNQNIGFFLDMKNSRQWLQENVSGKSVLNLFSYTCAFSVVAANAGAKLVVNMDMAKGALATGKLNHQINHLDMKSVFFFAHDIFKSWGKIRKYGQYDCIILDPPSFQPGSFDAQKDYIKLVKKMPELLVDGGVVLACLNSPDLDFDFLRELFAGVGGFVERQVIPAPGTFPEVDSNKGLKTIVYEKLAQH
ncbi:MAG: methyltransferase [Moraxellaceae bacterium]|nr:MAG: methyltransferase [Moraxellaceae bacterium]